MNIVSKYKDYYDFAIGHDTDSKKVYVREFSRLDDALYPKININRTSLNHIRSNHSDRYKYWYSLDSSGKLLGRIYINGGYTGPSYEFTIVCICGLAYQLLEIETNIEEPNKDKEIYIGENIPMDYVYKSLEWDSAHIKRILDPKYKYADKERKALANIKVPMETNANDLLGTPVLKLKSRQILLNPPLCDLKFGSVIKPIDMYNTIYNWIQYVEPATDTDPTNMNRYESKGFDKKTSFRNM